MGKDRHGHYEFFPYVNLAHWRLYPLVDASVKQRLAALLPRRGSSGSAQRAERNPYRIGTPLRLVLDQRRDRLRHPGPALRDDDRRRDVSAPWPPRPATGSSGAIPGASRSCSAFPREASRPAGPITSSSSWRTTCPWGAWWTGPWPRSINEGLKYSTFGPDPLAQFQSDVAVYHDEFADFSTNEPIIDGTVSLLLLLDLWSIDRGIVTMNPNMIGAYGPWAAGLAGEGPARLSFRNPRFQPGDLDGWRTQARGRLQACLLQPDSGGVPRAQVQHQFVYDGLHVEHLSWQLPYGPPTEAYFFKPAGATGRLPAVLGLHDHGGNKYFGARKIAQISDDAPSHDEDASARSITAA